MGWATLRGEGVTATLAHPYRPQRRATLLPTGERMLSDGPWVLKLSLVGMLCPEGRWAHAGQPGPGQ